jgi:DNA-binding beta-propeller fold protein YncE
LIENDEVFVADAVNNRVQVFAKNGDFIRSITTSPRMYLPYDVKLGPKGNLYVVEYGNNRIDKLTSDGELLASYTMEKDGFKTPWGLAVDSKGRVFVADTGNRRIVILTP